MARKIEEVNAEYQNTCAALGERTYQAKFVAEQIKTLTEKCESLQNEAGSILQEKAKEDAGGSESAKQ